VQKLANSLVESMREIGGVFCRVLVGKLFLVDLAGSERLKKSGIEQLPEPRTFPHFISHCNQNSTQIWKWVQISSSPTK